MRRTIYETISILELSYCFTKLLGEITHVELDALDLERISSASKVFVLTFKHPLISNIRKDLLSFVQFSTSQ